MDKIQLEEFSAFTDQIDAYIREHGRLSYCPKCPKPQLCVICMSSIGEAMLIQKIKTSECKRSSYEPIFLTNISQLKN